jgi:hypothetical protein
MCSMMIDWPRDTHMRSANYPFERAGRTARSAYASMTHRNAPRPSARERDGLPHILTCSSWLSSTMARGQTPRKVSNAVVTPEWPRDILERIAA